MVRVLHLLPQRPHLTGSGVTLDSVTRELAPALGGSPTMIPLPRPDRPDGPRTEDLPAMVERLSSALAKAGGAPPLTSLPPGRAGLTWGGVLDPAETVWRELMMKGRTSPGGCPHA